MKKISILTAFLLIAAFCFSACTPVVPQPTQNNNPTEGTEFVEPNSEEIKALKEKYPEYFGLETMKGLDVFVWKTAREEYKCGLLPGTNKTKTMQDIVNLKGTSPEEMKAILSTYNLDDSNVILYPFVNPESEFEYTISKDNFEHISNLFDKRYNCSSEFANTVSSDYEIRYFLWIYAGGRLLSATLAANTSVDALVELLKKGDIVINMSDYSNFEKVGDLPETLPENNRDITTSAGDIVLYQGNKFVIYYDTNSYSLTKIGHIGDVTQEELKELLGQGDVTVKLSLMRAVVYKTTPKTDSELLNGFGRFLDFIGFESGVTKDVFVNEIVPRFKYPYEGDFYGKTIPEMSKPSSYDNGESWYWKAHLGDAQGISITYDKGVKTLNLHAYTLFEGLSLPTGVKLNQTKMVEFLSQIASARGIDLDNFDNSEETEIILLSDEKSELKFSKVNYSPTMDMVLTRLLTFTETYTENGNKINREIKLYYIDEGQDNNHEYRFMYYDITVTEEVSQ